MDDGRDTGFAESVGDADIQSKFDGVIRNRHVREKVERIGV